MIRNLLNEPVKKCLHCGDDFVVNRRDKKYCSSNCKNLARYYRLKEQDEPSRVANSTEITKPSDTMTNQNMDSIYQFMFEQKKEENEKLKTELAEEKSARKEAEKQNVEHEKEHIKKDNLIEKLTEESEGGKKGLGGLLDDPDKLANLGNAFAPLIAAMTTNKNQGSNTDSLPPLQGVQLKNQHRAAEYGNFLEKVDDPEIIHAFLNNVAAVFLNVNSQIFKELEHYINSKYHQDGIRRQANQ